MGKATLLERQYPVTYVGSAGRPAETRILDDRTVHHADGSNRYRQEHFTMSESKDTNSVPKLAYDVHPYGRQDGLSAARHRVTESW